MAIKKRYAKREEIPEALRDLYTKAADGSFALDLDDDGGDGGDDGAGEIAKKLAQFRENNRKLMAEQKAREDELTALRAKVTAFGDADPAQVQAVLAALQGNEDASLIKAGRLDDVVAKRMRTREADWQKRLDDATKAAAEREADAAKTRAALATKVLREKFGEAAAAKKVRIRQSAYDDFHARVERDWKVNDPFAADFAPAKDGAPWDKPEAYIDELVRQAPHLFEESVGGGAGGSNPGRIHGGVRTYRRSELDDRQYASVLADVAAGKAKVELDK